MAYCIAKFDKLEPYAFRIFFPTTTFILKFEELIVQITLNSLNPAKSAYERARSQASHLESRGH